VTGHVDTTDGMSATVEAFLENSVPVSQAADRGGGIEGVPVGSGDWSPSASQAPYNLWRRRLEPVVTLTVDPDDRVLLRAGLASGRSTLKEEAAHEAVVVLGATGAGVLIAAVGTFAALSDPTLTPFRPAMRRSVPVIATAGAAG
jgi:hypothetical protein